MTLSLKIANDKALELAPEISPLVSFSELLPIQTLMRNYEGSGQPYQPYDVG